MRSSDSGWAGRTVWIVGASSGIGRVLALNLAGQGAAIVLSARNRNDLETVRGQLAGENHRIASFDITDPQACNAAASEISSGSRRIDHIVCFAGHYAPMSLDSLEPEEVRTVIAVNLQGAFNLIHAALPVLKAQQGGQIALCASIAGYRGLPNGQPYSATKAGIINLAESLRAEMARYGIDVRLICPGFVRTRMTAKNDFPMPMMIEPEQAAERIAAGLLGGSFEIHFPKRLTLPVKLLGVLPDPLYFRLAGKLVR